MVGDHAHVCVHGGWVRGLSDDDGWRPRRPVWVGLLVVVAVLIVVPIVVSAVFYVLRPMGRVTFRSWGITRSSFRSVGSSDS